MKRINVTLTGAQLSALICCCNHAVADSSEDKEIRRRINTAQRALATMIDTYGYEPVMVAGMIGFGQRKPK